MQNTKDFYRAFEDRFRGSRDLIKSRLQIYLPIIEPLKRFDTEPVALDLGCGRGEWLEVLRESGFRATGIDLDEGMLDSARQYNLNAINGDAIEYLKKSPSESQLVISGFHIAEHLPFEILQVLIEESFRVLKPGGVLILETPNPENILVGTSRFYLDPTHQRPLPPALLSFLPEHYGFEKVRVLGLQEAPNLLSNSTTTLFDVLTQVSPDYAIVAQKGGNEEITMALFAQLEIARGINLEDLTNRFDSRLMANIDSTADLLKLFRELVDAEISNKNAILLDQQKFIGELTQTLASLSTQLGEIDARARIADELSALKLRLAQEQATRTELLLQDAQTQVSQLRQEREDLLRSRSWRMTAPLRALSAAFDRKS